MDETERETETETYLARARLDLAVETDDPKQLLRDVLRLYPGASSAEDAGREKLGLLYRLDRGIAEDRQTLWLQCGRMPDFSQWPSAHYVAPPEARPVREERSRIQRGDHYQFRLLACPTMEQGGEGPEAFAERHALDPAAKRRHGRRVPVPDRDLQSWLAHEGDRGGFELSNMTHLRLPALREVHLVPYLYEGTLQVGDADLFRTTLLRGIGRSKAFGFGLLSIC
jgi:CRISPR system Cascade subunit CasE